MWVNKMVDTKKFTNELNRLYFSTVDGAKNNVMQVLSNAVAKGALKIDREVLPTLLAFIGSAIDDSKLQMHRGFDKNVRNFVEELNKELNAMSQKRNR
jgi:hypothetical protein